MFQRNVSLYVLSNSDITLLIINFLTLLSESGFSINLLRSKGKINSKKFSGISDKQQKN
jgi:hypothetical protein